MGSREHYQRNRDKVLQKCREYYQKNRERILERDRKHRKSWDVRTRIHAYQKIYRQTHPERIKNYQSSSKAAESRANYRRSEHGRQVRRVYQQTMTGAEKIRQSSRNHRQKLRLDLIYIVGSECVECGFNDVRALQIDHIHNDGYLDRKRFGSSTTIYRYYCKHPDEARTKLQILCANCNWIKIHIKTQGAITL